VPTLKCFSDRFEGVRWGGFDGVGYVGSHDREDIVSRRVAADDIEPPFYLAPVQGKISDLGVESLGLEDSSTRTLARDFHKQVPITSPVEANEHRL
jgi:hypothetical protein